MHPYLLHLGHLYLPTFGVLSALGLMAALLLSQCTARLAGVDPDALWNAGLFAIVCVYVLSRLLLLATHPGQFSAFPWLLLAVPSVTSAGLVLSFIATLLWLGGHHVPQRGALDAWAPCAALAWMFLAAGQYLAGSDPEAASGLPVPYASAPVNSTTLYTAGCASLLFLSSFACLSQARRCGETAGATLVLGGIMQYLLALQRSPATPLWLELTRSEWLSLMAVAAGGLLIAFARPTYTDKTEAKPA